MGRARAAVGSRREMAPPLRRIKHARIAFAWVRRPAARAGVAPACLWIMDGNEHLTDHGAHSTNPRFILSATQNTNPRSRSSAACHHYASPSSHHLRQAPPRRPFVIAGALVSDLGRQVHRCFGGR
jgi:hypothetical protein